MVYICYKLLLKLKNLYSKFIDIYQFMWRSVGFFFVLFVFFLDFWIMCEKLYLSHCIWEWKTQNTVFLQEKSVWKCDCLTIVSWGNLFTSLSSWEQNWKEKQIGLPIVLTDICKHRNLRGKNCISVSTLAWKSTVCVE